MKNYIKLFGIIAFVAVIGFSFISCEEEEEITVEATDGKLTITGLTAGDNVIVRGKRVGNSFTLIGGADITGTTEASITYVQVPASGTAVLKIWVCSDDLMKFTNYNKSETVTDIEILKHGSNSVYKKIVTVTFASGVGSGAAAAP